MKAAIVIPVYKELVQLQESEIKSITRCLEIFTNNKVFLVGPKSLSTNEFHLNFSVNGKKLGQKLFDDFYFKSIEGYNKLLLSPLFYKTFNDFDYILICQTDAYVFRDELEYWCSLGYDYIGAPIINLEDITIHSKVNGGLNGGFSLRKVKSHLRVLRSFHTVLPSKIEDKEESGNLFIRLIKKANWFFRYNSFWLLNNFNRNEDLFWSWGVPKKVSWFRIPSFEVACKFAFEKYPSKLFAFGDHQLPFGCHAWQKYEPDFWIDHIK